MGSAYNLLSEAVKLSPDDLMSNRNLGLVLLLSRKYYDAEQVLARSLRKVPNDMVLNRMLARALLGQRKTSAAQATYEKAATMALRTRGLELAAIYTELGPMYVESGKLDQAVSVLETAVKEAGATTMLPVAQRNLSIAHFRRGLARMRDPKQSDAALDDMVAAAKAPRGTLTNKESAAVLCGEAIAALKSNKVSAGRGLVGPGDQDRRRQRAASSSRPTTASAPSSSSPIRNIATAAARRSARARSSCSRS